MDKSFFQILRMMYWSGRRHKGATKHLFGVLTRFLSIYAIERLRKLAMSRQPLLALSMVEHMGDIVVAEPVARYVRQKHPAAKLVWIARPPFVGLVSSYPAVDRILTVRCLTEWMLLWSSGLFDEVVDVHLSGRYCSKCVVPMSKPGDRGKVTTNDYYEFGTLLEAQCRSAGLPPLHEGSVLTPDDQCVKSLQKANLPPAYVVIHCASNEEMRDWPAEHWRKLIDYIVGTLDICVVEIGLRPRVIHADTPKERNLCGVLSIMESAELIRRASVFIGIDSGPAHLANAVQTPGIILLGAYRNFPRYMPYNGFYATDSGAELLRASGPVANLPVSDVIAAVDKRIPLRTTTGPKG